MKRVSKKIVLNLILGGIIFSIILPILFFPQKTSAQWLTTDLPHIATQVGKFIKDFALRIKDLAEKTGVANLFKNVVNEFERQILTETATWIATGGNEGEPLFFWDKDYWAKMGDSLAAETLDSISKNMLGFSVCEEFNPQIKLGMLLSLPVPTPIEPFRPDDKRCSLSDIAANLTSAVSDVLGSLFTKFDQHSKFIDALGNEVAGGKFRSSFISKKFAELISLETELLESLKDYGKQVDMILKSNPPQGGPEEKELKRLEGIVNSKANEVKGKIDYLKHIIFDCPSLNPRDFCSNNDCVQVCEPPLTEPPTPLAEYCAGPKDAEGKYTYKNTRDCIWTLYSVTGPLQASPTQRWFNEFNDRHDDIIKQYENLKTSIYKEWSLRVEVAMKESVGAAPLIEFTKSTAPHTSVIGKITKLSDELSAKVDDAVQKSWAMQLLKGEWKAPTTKISEEPQQPAAATEEAAAGAMEGTKKGPTEFTGDWLADAIGLFLNTLASKMYEQLTQGKLFGGQFMPPPQGGVAWEKKWGQLFKEAGRELPSGTKVGPTETARKSTTASTPLQPTSPEELKAIYADVFTTPLKKGELISLISEFSTCPQDTRYALPNNCVIDTSFARAVEQELTIKEAMEKNYLHPDWYVSAPNSHLGNIDNKKDYSKRYSLTNATILAQAGIMPLGFQIAAQKISEDSKLADKQFTLRQIVDDFYTEGSPFYHLVNPNWRLKEFSAVCDLMGYSSIPQTNSAERQEACLQHRTCTGEKDDGTCHSWNYCTAYRNSWRFNADTCNEQYDSCQQFTRVRDNAKFTWLEKTLDFSSCDANSVGCQWYCKHFDRNLGQVGKWNCAQPGKKTSLCTLPNKNKCSETTGCDCSVNGRRRCKIPYDSTYCFYYDEDDPYNVIFFNHLVETCQPTAEGCTQFIRTKEDLGTNLFANSSFEEYSAMSRTSGASSSVAVRGWEFSTTPEEILTGKFTVDETRAYSGKVFAEFTGTNGGTLYPSYYSSHKVEFLPATKYFISFMAKNESTDDREIFIELSGALPLSDEKITVQHGGSWQYFSYGFITKDTLDPSNKYIYQIKIRSSGPGILLDDVQLEIGSGPSLYKDYGQANLIYLKKSPDPLCYDRDSNNNLITANDDPSCSNFVKSCLQSEVGCERYTPVNGEPALPAVAKEKDRCPAECVGYNSFREMPTEFYSTRDVTFIPKTAQICPANEVDCEGYTNLEEVARGGEGREFYSYLRPCQKPDGQCANFYIWVGSELQGYQLRKYVLRKDIDGSPAQIISDQERAEAIWGKCQGPEDARTNPNCREFYDENGNIFYRLYKNTITCNDTCLQLRKNKPISASACWPTLFADNNPLNPDPSKNPFKAGLIEGLSFTITGGESCSVLEGERTCWTESKEICDLGKPCVAAPGYGGTIPTCPCYTGICTLTTLPAESVRCAASSEGCREYKGNNANNIKVSFLDNFESGTVYPWTALTGSEISYSNDSIYFGGHSLKVREEIAKKEAGKMNNQAKTITQIFKIKSARAQVTPGLGAERTLYGLVSQGKSYLLSLLVKGISDNQKIYAKFSPSDISFSEITVSKEWRLINLGPIYFDKLPDRDEKLQITSDSTFWLDYIQLRDTGSLYLIRNSWQTPSTCDDQNGYPIMVGCAEYRDRDNSTHYLKSFSKLCNDEVVGCEALINTHNSSSPFEEKFNNDKLPQEDDIIVAADETEYFVYNSGFSCQAQDKGCQRFGLPDVSAGQIATIWSDVFLKNDPDVYVSRPTICRFEQQGCEEFNVSSGGSVYFKYPGQKQCVWREKVIVGNEEKSGWFQINTTQPCYLDENGNPYIPKGVSYYGIRFNNDPAYQGVAGVCPEKEIGCKSFIDPLLTGQDNYVLNPGFEDEATSGGLPADKWYNSMNCIGGVRAGICERIPWPQGLPRLPQAEGGAGKNDYLLKIEQNIPEKPDSSDPRRVYQVQQTVAGDANAGNNYLLTFSGYIENLAKYNWAGAAFTLNYEGIKSLEELKECAAKGQGWCDDDWVQYYRHCSLETGSEQDCCSWVRGRWDGENRKCDVSSVSPRDCQLGRGNLKACIAAHYDWGYKPGASELSAWAWNYEHGYTTGGTAPLDSTKTREWQKVSLKIEAGGDLNPLGFALRDVSVGPILSPPRWDSCDLNNDSECQDPWNPAKNSGETIPWKCCSASGKVYFDNFALKPFTPYYLRENAKIDKGGCNGKVSLEQGCVLFADEKLGTYSYNSHATYAKSQALKGQAVEPIDCEKIPFITSQSKGIKIGLLDRLFLFFVGPVKAQTQAPVKPPALSASKCNTEPYSSTDYCKYCYPLGQTKNDTNLILKVSSTRICAQWLHCTSTTKIWQKEMSDFIEVCNGMVRCQRQLGEGEKATCVSTVDVSNEPLNEEAYINRDVSWFGLEPGGYSLYKWRPIEKLATKVGSVSFKSESIPNQLLLTSYQAGEELGVSERCGPQKQNCPSGSFCQGGICLVNLSPQAFPEKDAPFNPQLAKTFENINVCEIGMVNCDAIDNQSECQNNGCVWDEPFGTCGIIDCHLFDGDAEECCDNKGCYWSSSQQKCYMFRCRGRPKEGPIENTCDAGSQHGCFWNESINRCDSKLRLPEPENLWQYFSCQPSYKKAEYGVGGSIKKYFNVFPANSWPGVCVNGDKSKIGKSCWEKTDCGNEENALCELLVKETSYYAKNNFCLSRDLSRPEQEITKACLLWYPSAHLLIPVVKTETPATTARTATLKGTLLNFGADTSAITWFEWGSEREKVENGEGEKVGQQTGRPRRPFTHKLENLIPETTYYFRAAASNTHGTAYGNTEQFTTAPTPEFDFDIEISPNEGIVVNGETVTPKPIITVTMTSSEANPQEVSFSASEAPSGIEIEFSPTSCTPSPESPCTSEVTITAPEVPPAGGPTYTFNIIGRSAEREHSKPYTLTIKSRLTIINPGSQGWIYDDEGQGQIYCGVGRDDCHGDYDVGTQVIIHVCADTRTHYFEKWEEIGEGKDCKHAGTEFSCTLTMDNDKKVEAIFGEIGIFLNSAENISCNTKCLENNYPDPGCMSVGTNYDKEKNEGPVDNGAFVTKRNNECFLMESAVNCASEMESTGLECGGNDTDWTYCKCGRSNPWPQCPR